NHPGDAERFESAAGQFGAARGSARWQMVAVNVREVDTGPLEDLAVGKYPALAATALGPLPAVAQEARLGFQPFETGTQTLLQSEQVIGDGAGIRHRSRIVVAIVHGEV